MTKTTSQINSSPKKVKIKRLNKNTTENKKPKRIKIKKKISNKDISTIIEKVNKVEITPPTSTLNNDLDSITSSLSESLSIENTSNLNRYKCFVPIIINRDKAKNCSEYSSITLGSSITSIISNRNRQLCLYNASEIDDNYIFTHINGLEEKHIISTKTVKLMNGLEILIVFLNTKIGNIPNSICNDGSSKLEWWDIIDLYEYTRFDPNKTIYQNLCVLNDNPYYNLNKKINLLYENNIIGYIQLYDIYRNID